MKRIIFLFVLLISSFVFSCGGGGGGGGTSLQPPTYNLAGEWIVTNTPQTDSCQSSPDPPYSFPASATHAAGSNTATFIANGDSTNMTVSGTSMTYSSTYSSSGCASVTELGNFTVSDASHFTGTVDWTCQNTGGSCHGTDSITAIRQAPAIFFFTPTSGPVGTTVTISGINFSATAANNTVHFNSTTATVTNSTTTSITTTVPDEATTGLISVIVSGQTATAAANFTVSGGDAGTPEIEPNDAVETSQVITVNQTINGTTSGGYVSGSADYDGYMITAPTTGIYTITITFGNTGDLDMDLYDSNPDNPNLLTGSYTAAFGGNETITYTLTGGSTYYIVVYPYESSATTSYALTVQ